MFLLNRLHLKSALLLSTAVMACAAAPHVRAQDTVVPAASQDNTDVGDKDIKTVIIKAERNRAAANAPTKASVDATQPQSIISRPYIELAVPETGDFTNVIHIAPSISGTQGNGAGYGDAKLVMRGFQDGEYNVTYDGVAYGDTNDPTHHSNTFFPASTIGAVVVDRGPGAAGDLGQENFGGSIHMFSNKVSDDFGFTQKLSYGSFNSWQAVSILQTGRIEALHGLKVLVNLQERNTDGALSYFSLKSENQSIKAELPINDHWNLTVLATHNFNFAYQPDNDGATLRQVEAFGKNYYMNNDPNSPQYYKNNRVRKHTDFSYARLNGDLGNGFTLEDTLYTYFYSNSTFSAADATTFGAYGVAGSDLGGEYGTHPGSPSGSNPSGMLGYDKLNHYTVRGDILRLNKAWDFGTLKVGGLVESSNTRRHRYDYQIDTTNPYNSSIFDFKEKACKNAGPGVTAATATACAVDDRHIQLEEISSWTQSQLFADFYWTPTDKLTITPGLKVVDFERSDQGKVKAANVKNELFMATPMKNSYSKTLQFLTVNYKLMPNWSLYGQYATGFLIPPLSSLYVFDTSKNTVEPQTSTNYQLGTVYNGSHLSIDGDIYQIDVDNKFFDDATGDFFTNGGKVQYKGVEGQAAYAFDFGLTAFVNGSLNSAKDANTDTSPAFYNVATAGKTLAKAPKSTLGLGGIYHSGPLKVALTYKLVGEQFADNKETAAYKIDAYDVTDLAVSYDFGRIAAKIGVDNLFDHRDNTKITLNGAPYDQYYWQAPRNVMLTLSAKY